VVDINRARVARSFFVKSLATDEDSRSAETHAVTELLRRFRERVRTQPLLRRGPTIVEINGPDIVIDEGRRGGVRLGDRFTTKEGRGTLVAREVKERLSILNAVVGGQSLSIGDSVLRRKSMGFEVSVQGRGLVDVSTVSSLGEIVPSFGVDVVLNRGFFRFRPTVGLSLALSERVEEFGYLALRADAGGEMHWYLGYFRLKPRAAVGVAFGLPTIDAIRPRVSHVGGVFGARLALELTRRVGVFVEGGGSQWIGLNLPGFGGPYAQLGVTIR
jgi:hypothetical protein